MCAAERSAQRTADRQVVLFCDNCLIGQPAPSRSCVAKDSWLVGRSSALSVTARVKNQDAETPVSKQLCGPGTLCNAFRVSVAKQDDRTLLGMIVEPTVQLDGIVCSEPRVDGIVVVGLPR